MDAQPANHGDRRQERGRGQERRGDRSRLDRAPGDLGRARSGSAPPGPRPAPTRTRAAPTTSSRPGRRGVSQPGGRRPTQDQRDQPDRDVDEEDPAPGRREQVAATSPSSPAPARAPSAWTDARMAAPTNGPAAIPRNVSAPMMPRARGRAAPRTGGPRRRSRPGPARPPPSAWMIRAAMSWSRLWDGPASSEPTMKTASAPMNGRRAPHRSVSRPASGIVRMYTSR